MKAYIMLSFLRLVLNVKTLKSNPNVTYKKLRRETLLYCPLDKRKQQIRV